MFLPSLARRRHAIRSVLRPHLPMTCDEPRPTRVNPGDVDDAVLSWMGRGVES